MTARRAAPALRAALTFSFAVLVHGAVHAAGDRGFAWDSPVHVALLAVGVILLGGAGAALGLGRSGPERRRRLALVRAALPPAGTPAGIARELSAQAGIAAAIFLAEGPVLAPQRLGLALACGLVALTLSAFVFRRVAGCVVDLLAALDAPRERRAAALPRRAGAPLPVLVAADFRLFVPNRPPPLAA